MDGAIAGLVLLAVLVLFAVVIVAKSVALIPQAEAAVIERLGRSPAKRQTRLVRVTDVGQACLVDVQVRSGERSEAGLFLLAPAREGGIVAMR